MINDELFIIYHSSFIIHHYKNMKRFIDLIAQRAEIQDVPPVLMDIGASEGLNPIWKDIARFSIGIAFDADDRDFAFIEKEKSDFKKLFVFNGIATDKVHQSKQPFYLTRSPYCSSTLKPDTKGLAKYAFASAFDIVKTVDLNAVQPNKILQEIGVDYIDWFKSDTQGTDLRLFKNLSLEIQNKSIIVQMEPGIINAYVGEDKMVDCIAYMSKMPFDLTEMIPKGSIYLTSEMFQNLFTSSLKQKIARHVLKNTAGWTELTFYNDFSNASVQNIRHYLLGWLFNSLQGHHAVAYSTAEAGLKQFDDKLLVMLRDESARKLKNSIWSLKIIETVLKKIF
jgi:hypothetical protein